MFLLPRLDRLLLALPGQQFWQSLSRSDRLPAAGSETGLPPGLFDVVPAQFSHAAVSRQGEKGDAGNYVWLRADPCWLQPDLSALRMMACGQMQLTAADAEHLAALLRPLFGDAGIELSIPHPERWFLKLPMGSDPPRFSRPEDVLGDDVEKHLPDGNSGLRWKRLLNEVQMTLHQHPVNRRREAAGLAPVNSLWFWGGGRVPNRVRALHARYFSDDDLLRGLARHSNVPYATLPGSLLELDKVSGSAFDLRGIAPQPLLENWLEPMRMRLRSSAESEACFAFSGGERFLLKRAHRWRFWRKPVQLESPSVQVGETT